MAPRTWSEGTRKADLTVELGPRGPCEGAGAVCTADGRMLSNTLSAVIAGPPSVSVADAPAPEGAHETVDFAVSLSRAAREAVTVDYATGDGTAPGGATAGEDYAAASGTLTFGPGETQMTVSVAVLASAGDGERFTLALSNAAGNHAWLADARATGTISNPDAALRVTGAAVSSHPGDNAVWDAGETVEAAVRFSAPVTVAQGSGTGPALAVLLDGARRAAAYTGGSGTDTLTFAHTVTAADAGARTARVAASGLSLNGAALSGGAGQAVELGFAVAPYVTAVELLADGSCDRSWTAGETLEVRVTFSEAVTVAGGTPTLGVTVAGEAATLGYATRSAAQTSGYERLTEPEIRRRLDEADRIARGLGRRTELPDGPEGIALSGMRGKIGLTMLEDGGWGAAYVQALNTWIAKVEDNPRLPGEAGIEAICQRAFAVLGIDSAETASRVFDGVQTVLSRRSERVGAPETGNVRPRHQEDMAQALAYPCALKYDAGWRTEPRWRECHRLLSARAKDPDAEHRRLTQILAATWLIGHSDLYRRNLSFVHAEVGTTANITIAPLYDVSSARGLKNIDQTLAIGIARQQG